MRIDIFIIAILPFIVVPLVSHYLKTSGQLVTPRHISEDEKRAAKMFKQNCKQVGFTQGNKTKNTGVGLTTNGSAVFGTMSGSNEDTYNYVCDGNIQYTLTYDIENYRKYYK